MTAFFFLNLDLSDKDDNPNPLKKWAITGCSTPKWVVGLLGAIYPGRCPGLPILNP